MDLENLGCVFFISSSATLGKNINILPYTHTCGMQTQDTVFLHDTKSSLCSLHVLLLIIAGANISNKRITVPIDEKMKLYTSNFLNGEGNGTLLQYSCLENRMDGGTW